MKKMSELRERLVSCSSCYKCGWRYPLTANPRYCVLGIRSENDPKFPMMDHPHCKHYIHDDHLRVQLEQLLGMNSDLVDDICKSKDENGNVTVTIPTDEVGYWVSRMMDTGKSCNFIRAAFGMDKVHKEEE